MAESSSELLRAILNGMPALVMLVDLTSGEIEQVGSHGASLLGYSETDLRSRPARDLVYAEDLHRILDARRSVEDGQEERVEVRFVDSSGALVPYLVTLRPFDDERVLIVCQQSASVVDSNSSFSDLAMLADLSDDIFVVSTRDGFITYINSAATAVHGDREFIGQHLSEFVEDSSWAMIADRIRSGEQRLEARVAAEHLDGSTRQMELRSRFDEETQQWFTVQRDVSAQVEHEQGMRRMNGELRRRATTDSLTGVANREAFTEAVELAIGDGHPFSVLLLDMDDFKSVNDTLGHGAGDDFLRVLARRLQSTITLQDLVARLGGDEFVVYVPGLGASEAALLATRILKVMSAPFQIGPHSLSRSCSIGGATWAVGDTFSDVLRKADQAAYQAKHAGRSRFAMHEGPSDGFPIESGHLRFAGSESE